MRQGTVVIPSLNLGNKPLTDLLVHETFIRILVRLAERARVVSCGKARRMLSTSHLHFHTSPASGSVAVVAVVGGAGCGRDAVAAFVRRRRRCGREATTTLFSSSVSRSASPFSAASNMFFAGSFRFFDGLLITGSNKQQMCYVSNLERKYIFQEHAL